MTVTDTPKAAAHQPWSSKSLGGQKHHAIFYTMIRFCGWRGAYFILFWVVLWFTLLPSIRGRSSYYLKRRFPHSGFFALWLHAFRLQWEFGKSLVDRATAGILGKFNATASEEDAATLAALYAQGRGVITLTAHVGCWQMAMPSLLRQLQAPLSIIMHRSDLDHDRHYFEHRGENPPFAVIDPADGAAAIVSMMGALAQGHILGAMGDRPMGSARHTVHVPFMGGTIPLPYSVYRVASASGAPIVVFFALRTGPCAAYYGIASVVQVPAGVGKNPEAYMPFMSQYTKALEELTQKHPYQFFNFYNMWE